MKPDAPAEIRGEFKPIATPCPASKSANTCRCWPPGWTAAPWSGRWPTARTTTCWRTHQVLTGMAIPGGNLDQVLPRRRLAVLRRRRWTTSARGRDGVPTGVTLPTFLMEGPLTWPGQHAGFLGAEPRPLARQAGPEPAGLPRGGLCQPPTARGGSGDRHALLEQIDRAKGGSLPTARRWPSNRSGRSRSCLGQGGRGVRPGPRADGGPRPLRPAHVRPVAAAGPPAGRGRACRSCRRTWAIVQTWDKHGDIFPTLKNRLLPPLDRGVSRPDRRPGRPRPARRDAGGRCSASSAGRRRCNARRPAATTGAGRSSALFCGGGVTGGAVIGKTDKAGGAPGDAGLFADGPRGDDLPGPRGRLRGRGTGPASAAGGAEHRKADCRDSWLSQENGREGPPSCRRAPRVSLSA